MSNPRDPRVVAIAEKLAEVQPYGFEHMKVGPSAADYHAALLAVKTLDEQAEYEYNIETTDLITGHTHLLRTLWESDTDWLERKKEVLDDNDRALLNAGGGALEYTRRLVKRRKAGGIEDV